MHNKSKTYFITGGGTGGHIYPAIAVADYIREHEKDAKIYYIGNPQNLEYKIAEQKGYEFLPVNIHGMPRKISLGMIKWLFDLTIACGKCSIYLNKYKPDAIFGTGGYVSAPVLLAAMVSKKTPYMMHDCDAQPGLVTRKLAPKAKAVSLSFECACKYIKNPNCHINGNPIREAFKTLTKQEARNYLGLDNRTTLCIMGGSQGAKTINYATVEILKTLSRDYNLQIIFQTGRKNYDNTIARLKEVYPTYEDDRNLTIKPYFDDMVTVLKASDIAVSRAGSLSISELCASSIASILIPYPFAAADHQRKNAQYMVDKNAALYLEDSETSPTMLLEKITELIKNPDLMDNLQKNAGFLAKFDATQKIAEELDNLG